MFLYDTFLSLLTHLKDRTSKPKQILILGNSRNLRKLFRKEGMSGERMVGGLGSVKERDADVDIVIAKVRNEIEAKAKVSEILFKLHRLHPTPEYISR